MTERQRALLNRAHQALESARRLHAYGDTEGAINRAYYAMFYAASAVLLLKGEAPRTHHGVHHRFHLHFVASGDLPRELSAALSYALELRTRADYEISINFDPQIAAELLAEAERFVTTIEAWLQEISPD